MQSYQQSQTKDRGMNKYRANPYSSLAQAMDPRSSERGLSLKRQAPAEARLPTGGFVEFASSRLGEPSSPERDHPSLKGEVPHLG